MWTLRTEGAGSHVAVSLYHRTWPVRTKGGTCRLQSIPENAQGLTNACRAAVSMMVKGSIVA